MLANDSNGDGHRTANKQYRRAKSHKHMHARNERTELHLGRPILAMTRLEFPDGQLILLTSLGEDQEAVVVQLPAQAMTAVLGRKDESSRVYSFVASQHPYWVLSNLKSVLAHFTEEPIFLGTDFGARTWTPLNTK
jgi:hypothetical protein